MKLVSQSNTSRVLTSPAPNCQTLVITSWLWWVKNRLSSSVRMVKSTLKKSNRNILNLLTCSINSIKRQSLSATLTLSAPISLTYKVKVFSLALLGATNSTYLRDVTSWTLSDCLKLPTLNLSQQQWLLSSLLSFSGNQVLNSPSAKLPLPSKRKSHTTKSSKTCKALSSSWLWTCLSTQFKTWFWSSQTRDPSSYVKSIIICTRWAPTSGLKLFLRCLSQSWLLAYSVRLYTSRLRWTPVPASSWCSCWF